MKKLYPVKAASYTQEEKDWIAKGLLQYLDGLTEDEDLNGGDLVEKVIELISWRRE